MTLGEIYIAVDHYSLDHQEDVDTAYQSYTGQHISEDEYHNQIIQSGKVRQYRIQLCWDQLSAEDQLTYYLGCDHQSLLVGELNEAQKAAIVIIQDRLVTYD